MILRRISKALRRQDWFTVVIEIGIVVIGLLIGLQINNWNENRVEKQAEHKFLERLHAEIMATQDDLSGFSKIVETRESDLKAAARVVFGSDQEVELTGGQCMAKFLSHAYNFPPTDLPTISEILSSGQFNVISDDALRAALSRMGQINARAEKTSDLFNASPLNLPRAYPDLISVDYVLNTEGVETTADNGSTVQCDLAGMRGSQAYKNDFTINVERYIAYEHLVVERLRIQFDGVHAELDRVLGYSHEGDAQ